MKKLFFLGNFIFLLSLSFIDANAQGEAELKRVLQGPINEIFHRWDDEWSVDKYIDESASISYFEDSEYSNNQVFAIGSFTVKRWIGRVNVRFKAKINITNSGLEIKQLCYEDSSVEDTDCTSPSKYNMGIIRP